MHTNLFSDFCESQIYIAAVAVVLLNCDYCT